MKRDIMKTMRKVLVIILLIAGVECFYLAFKEYKPFIEADVKNGAIKEAVVTTASDPMERQIDFEALQNINPDIIGWLYAPQIGVDQPILRGSDNTKYLKMDFQGNYDPLGSIFTFTYTDEKLSDQHFCLFGHNMRSGQMFGQLDSFQDEAFMEENGVLYVYTPERVKEFKVNEVVICDKEDDIFQKEWGMDSMEQILTLATCSSYSSSDNQRLCVNCLMVREKVLL